MITVKNIYQQLPDASKNEVVEEIMLHHNVRLERISSQGQSSLAWQSSEQNEWVLLMQGAAKLCFAEPQQVLALKPGDYLLIPANCRHRVAWTSPQQQSIWLCCYYADKPLP